MANHNKTEEGAGVTDPVTIKPLFAAMPMSLNEEAAKDANVVYQFNLSGEGGGQFIVSIRHGRCVVEEGVASSPDVIIAAAASDYFNIATGQYPFGLAYINGRLKVEGNLRLVLRLGAYFAPTS
jgi:putative sterol carrier protein